MADDELVEKVREIVSTETMVPGDELTLDAPLAELGIDSLDVLRLAARLEQSFGFTITTAELQSVETLGDIIRGLAGKLDG